MLQGLSRWTWLVVAILVIFATVVVLWPSELPPESTRLLEAPTVPMRGLPDAYQPQRASFSLAFKDIQTNLPLASIFVMPGETVGFSASDVGTDSVVAEVESGVLTQTPDGWRWTAPASSGLYPLRFTRRRTRETIVVKAFVKVPLHPDSTSINGYRIGQYQRTPYRDNPFYTFPDGFVEVRPDLLEERVTPHFVLGQFIAKQVSDYPKYLLLHEHLILKLEMLLARLNESITSAPTFHVMSGFRTPHYNRLIGNETSYSVHLYGGAADIFVDADDDDYMDDLNGDGEADVADAILLAGLVESQVQEPGYAPFVGGLGIYEPAPHRGPFVHVDVRGEQARW